MKSILVTIFILLINNFYNSQRIVKKFEKLIYQGEFKFISDLTAFETFRNENFQKFGEDIYNFPYEKTSLQANDYLKEIDGVPAYVNIMNEIINNGNRFSSEGGHLNYEKVFYSLITSKQESKQVVQFYLFKMKNIKSAKELFNLSVQGCGNSKLIYAYRHNKFVVIINCGYFNILASKILFRIRKHVLYGQFNFPRGKSFEKNNSMHHL